MRGTMLTITVISVLFYIFFLYNLTYPYRGPLFICSIICFWVLSVIKSSVQYSNFEKYVFKTNDSMKYLGKYVQMKEVTRQNKPDLIKAVLELANRNPSPETDSLMLQL